MPKPKVNPIKVIEKKMDIDKLMELVPDPELLIFFQCFLVSGEGYHSAPMSGCAVNNYLATGFLHAGLYRLCRYFGIVQVFTQNGPTITTDTGIVNENRPHRR